MDNATRLMARYIESKGIQLSSISEATKIPYSALWSSLSSAGTRPLRADEYLSICKFIEKPAFDFYQMEDRRQPDSA